MTTNKLTVRACQVRVKEILAEILALKIHSPIGECKVHWTAPEHIQGLIDELREDVIQTIANGSKCPYALTRAIVELPRIHYRTKCVELPVMGEVAARFSRSLPFRAVIAGLCKNCHTILELDYTRHCFHCSHNRKMKPMIDTR